MLSLGVKKIRKGWLELAGVQPKLLITYVDNSRGFQGTVYKAANWQEIGLSAGKNYNKKRKLDRKPNKKKTFIYRLIKDETTQPVTEFENEYLRQHTDRMNSVAQYNYTE